LPITTEVAVLPGASRRPLGAYIASLASEEPDPADLLAVPVEPGPAAGGDRAVDPALNEVLPDGAAAIAEYQLTGAAGEAAPTLATIVGRAVSVLLLGVGDRSPRSLRRAGAELGRRMAAGGTATTSAVAGEAQEGIQAFAEGVLLGGYRFDLKSENTPPASAGRVRLLVGPDAGDAAAALRRAAVVAGAVALARDLANTPSVPNDGMKAMKTDMAGGAVVIAVLSALSRLRVPHRVTGLVAAAQNMPSGSAYRPGDVITQYGGRTVEVRNTDAEGRLVLADALAYAAATLEPDQLIDIATLTGAARVALGTTHAAMYATDDAIAASLAAVGQASGDRVWRMPLEDSYATALTSDVADICHIATDGTPAGSITAALFLREFAGGLPWTHLDIAGTGRSADHDGELAKGATGFGVRLLLRLLSQDALTQAS
jgi:leucyl aminopeptidase